MKIKEVFVKCPHCGSDEGFILGRCGCTLGIEFYFWCCCGTCATKEEFIEVITKVTENIEEVVKKSVRRDNMEKKTLILSDEDRLKLVEMQQRAYNTPCITVGLGHKDFATSAWEDVATFMKELGDKYGFDSTKIKGIDSTTGEVM